MNFYQVFRSSRWLLLIGLLLAGCDKQDNEAGRGVVPLNVQPESASASANPAAQPSLGARSTSTNTSTTPSNPQPGSPADGTGAQVTTRKLSDSPEVTSDAEIVKPAHASLSDQSGTDGQSSTEQPPAGGTQSNPAAGESASTANEIDPKLAALDTRVDYLALQLPPQSTAATWKSKDWINQIALTDRAMQSLILDQQAYNVSPSDFSSQARRLSEMKLTASEQLKAVATTPTENELAILGKLEALSQLAGFGDRFRANELLAFASEHSSFESKAVARQAALVLLGFSLNQINSDSSNPEDILKQVDVVLAERDKLRMPEFKMMEQVMNVLQRKNLVDLAKAVRQRMIDAFRDNSDLNLAYSSWQLGTQDSTTFQALNEELEKDPTIPTQLKKSIDNYLATDKTDWSLLWLAKQIKTLEFRGDSTGAGIVAEVVDSGKYVTPTIEEIALGEARAYAQHVKMIGQPLVLSELADLDGKPLDLSAYKGNVVLVTYWASWCPTCRAEFPDLRAMYEQYKARGFEIVGVNVDDTQSAMQSVVQAEMLPWPNFRSSNPNLFGLNTLAAQQVDLRATPFLILIDSTGKVAGLQLHGQKLKEQVERLLPR
jgi:thiol-disulfide isomerase/thioredoxin